MLRTNRRLQTGKTKEGTSCDSSSDLLISIERLNNPGQPDTATRIPIPREIWNNPVPELFTSPCAVKHKKAGQPKRGNTATR
jgi:hypothetical protein